jgi:DNA-binding transcriptional ArsR family regulator
MAARPATRSSARDSATAPSARVRDMRAPSAGPAVEWDVRTAYDFVFALSDDAGATDDLPSADRAWLAEAKADLKSQVGEATELYGKEFCVVLAGLAVDRPEVTDAASLVALLRRVPDDTVVRLILGEDLRDPERGETAERAMSGDAEAILTMLDHLEGHGDDRAKGMAVSLYRDPRSLIDPAIAVLTAWLPSFQAIEARVGAMIRQDWESRAGDRAALDPLALIERTTGGIRWLSEPGVRRVILAPSYFARPYNFLLGSEDWRLFGYPISDASIDAADPFAPPPSVIRLHRALGDETRLRILRLLRDRDLYLTEIAQELDLSKPTIKHHLALLRAAGLVTITEAGSVIYYSLRPTRLDDGSDEIKRFLLG